MVLLLDSSGSICGNDGSATTCNNWDIIKDFALDLTTFLLSSDEPNNRARVAIVRFSLHVYQDVGFMDYSSLTPDLEDKIRNLPYANSWTNTSGALQTARLSVFTPGGGDRPDVPNVAIVITDGQPKISGVSGDDIVEETLEAAQDLKNKGVTIFAVGVTYTAVTDFISERVLKRISSPPQVINQNYWKVRDFESLQVILSSIANRLCASEYKAVISRCFILLLTVWRKTICCNIGV